MTEVQEGYLWYLKVMTEDTTKVMKDTTEEGLHHHLPMVACPLHRRT